MKRKSWRRPAGLSELVLAKLYHWQKHYDMGRVSTSRAVPNPREPELKDTVVLERAHTIKFKFNELEWLNSTLQLENPKNRQAVFFKVALDKFKQAQQQGKVAPHGQLSLELSLGKDELDWIVKLIECVINGNPTPSERQAAKQEIGKGDW